MWPGQAPEVSGEARAEGRPPTGKHTDRGSGFRATLRSHERNAKLCKSGDATRTRIVPLAQTADSTQHTRQGDDAAHTRTLKTQPIMPPFHTTRPTYTYTARQMIQRFTRRLAPPETRSPRTTPQHAMHRHARSLPQRPPRTEDGYTHTIEYFFHTFFHITQTRQGRFSQRPRASTKHTQRRDGCHGKDPSAWGHTRTIERRANQRGPLAKWRHTFAGGLLCST